VQERKDKGSGSSSWRSTRTSRLFQSVKRVRKKQNQDGENNNADKSERETKKVFVEEIHPVRDCPYKLKFVLEIFST